MSLNNIESATELTKVNVDSEEQQFHDWNIKFKQSHILHSQCSTPFVCKKPNNPEKCLFCMYVLIKSFKLYVSLLFYFCSYCSTLDLPHLPDMVFPNNILKLQHNNGGTIEFNALDALKIVSHQPLSLRVSSAQIWRESR